MLDWIPSNSLLERWEDWWRHEIDPHSMIQTWKVMNNRWSSDSVFTPVETSKLAFIEHICGSQCQMILILLSNWWSGILCSSLVLFSSNEQFSFPWSLSPDSLYDICLYWLIVYIRITMDIAVRLFLLGECLTNYSMQRWNRLTCEGHHKHLHFLKVHF